MAQDSGTQLTAVWFLASFLWLSYSSQRHLLLNQPRLSSTLLLLITGALAFVTSLFSKWLPGADGRFDSDAILKASPSSLPPRPRRFYIPCIIILIVLRLEICHTILYNFQCSTAGIEAFLPLVLATYRFLSYRPPPVVSDEPEDPWQTPLEDLRQWLGGSPIGLLLSTGLLSYGAFMAAGFTSRSTYVCSAHLDQRSYIVFLQWVGILMDATIIILSWRVLSWARTTRTRLRTLGSVMLTTSFVSCVTWLLRRLPTQRDIINHEGFRGVGSLYVFDTISTGIVVATLVITAALLVCDPSPLEPIAVATFVTGTFASIGSLLLVGTYQQTSAVGHLFAQSAITTGFITFMYSINLRRFAFIKRVFLFLVLASVLGSFATHALFKQKTFQHHPIDELVYNNRIEADRWLRHAAVSTTLKAAVNEYKERYGRDPPRDFDKWFEFTREKNSVVIDQFDQIEHDVFPFWGLRPEQIRERLDFIMSQPNVGVVRIVNGKASHSTPTIQWQDTVLDELVMLISSFAEHLPNMFIPINLVGRPRVLTPWNDLHQLRMAATKPGIQLFPNKMGKRDVSDGHGPNTRAPPAGSQDWTVLKHISAHDFRQVEALSCPPGSPTRGGVHWDVRDFCAACTVPHSKEQFLADWQMSLDPCHQPDTLNLHDFHTTAPNAEIYQNLLPLFSGSKTPLFNDIVVPLWPTPTNEKYKNFDDKSFNMKQNALFWQIMVPDIPLETVHSGQRQRLMYLGRNGTASDKISMLLGIGADQDSRFRYEDVPATEANGILPFPVLLTNPGDEKCEAGSPQCEYFRNEFGVTTKLDSSDAPSGDGLSHELNHKYILALDTSFAPPPNLLNGLHSNSVPVVSTIFTQWFTERLKPWVHFIPLDLRFHALHSTLSYFIGLDGRGKLNGREQITPPRAEDAKWIADEGRKWAQKALRSEDREVYWFRLLLEWARVLDDDREEIGFKLMS
ncbi:hypothetical protein F5Y16DRAFT_359862 [Xylariaceae sp. FL0255]|nr:hypothetical protein F5Y16DRAFT_359862 [Xylariaceae sp. FL0255]